MSGNYPPSDNPGGLGGSGGSGGPGGSGPQYQGPGGPYQGGPGQGPGQPLPGQTGPGGYPGPGGPSGQQPYGGPQQPYPGYGQGPMGPGQPPMGPGQPPPHQPGGPAKKGFPLVLVVVGAVVLVLIVGAIVAGIALTRRAQTAGTDPGGGSNVPGQSSAPPVADKPSDAVKAYLEALAAGDADAALALGDTAPSDSTFLTSEVLAASKKLAPITGINVPEVDDEYAYRVAASFKLGDQAVDENFSVTKAGSSWKLRDAFNEIDLSARNTKDLPTIINGVQAKTSKVRLFPGAYQFTTGSENVSWGENDVLLVQSPSEYPRGLSDIKPTLTDKGEKGFKDAVSASVAKCLKSNRISNPGCPNDVDPKKINSTYKFKDGTIQWEASRADTAVEDMTTRLEYSNPAIVTAFINLGLTAVGECDAPGGGKCTLYPSRSLQPRANLLTSPVKLTWT